MRFLGRLLVTLSLCTGFVACTSSEDGAGDIAAVAVPDNGLGPLTGKFFGSGSDVMVIILHGDISRGGTAESMYPRAEEIASRFPNAKVVSILRPGYADDEGRKSPGRTLGRRDHYTPVNNAAVADTIANLKAANAPSKVLALGYSGGAAQLGTIIGIRPGLVDGAVLLACPCDIAKWRALKGRRPWPRSQSPIDYVDQLDADIRIIAITGADDPNTFPVLAEDYVAAVKARGIEASLMIIPGAEHRYSQLRDAVLTAFNDLM